MEDDLRPELGEDLAHALLVLAVGEDGLGELHVALVDAARARSRTGSPRRGRAATSVLRVHAGDLAAQLGADRAAGAGDEHGPAGQVAADGLDLHPHRVAPQHVLDLDVAQLAGELAAGLESSKTVGTVRTVMPRLRQALTTAARSVPGADGIAIITSSGSTSSSTSGRSSIVPCTSAHALLLAGRRRRSRPAGSRAPGSCSSSLSSSRPPSPAPTISTERASRRGRKPFHGRW